MTRALLVALACLIATVAPAVAAPVVGKTTSGDPKIQAIDTIAFASDGVLLISDGRSNRIVAIQTGDTKPVKGEAKVQNILGAIAKTLGGAEKDVEIAEIAVNPASKRVYVLVKKLDEKKNVLVSVDPAGKVERVKLDNVPHSTVTLPTTSGGAPRVTEMAWAGDRLVLSARTGEEFASKIMVVPAPLGPDAAGSVISAETYHISHRKWETKAPMAAIFPYEENGRKYIVGGFGCTPIVKYPIDAIQNGAKVKGESMIELGSGNRPMNMFAYTKNGKASVIVNTFRFHHQRAPLGPSPYWACRFDQSILGSSQVNETAMRREVKNPDAPAANVAKAFHGVMHMDKLSETHAVVVIDRDGRQDLDVLELP